MGLQQSYTLLAPIYDLIIKRASQQARINSLAHLEVTPNQPTLLCGIGSGLDLPHLPASQEAIGIDLTRAMLKRINGNHSGNNIALCQGDVMSLPFPDDHFPSVVMHLILAVVPQPKLALREAVRVLQPGGQLLILDKFIPQHRKAWLRRAISPIIGRIATRTDVIFEELLAEHPTLKVVRNEGALLNGWFRSIELRKP